MHRHHHRVLLRRVKRAGIQQPALHPEAVVRPMQIFCFAPQWFSGAILVRYLLPVAWSSRPDFRRLLPRMPDYHARLAVGSHGNSVVVERRIDAHVTLPEPFLFSRRRIELRNRAASVEVLREKQAWTV